jgi:type II secretory pathway pseudopilin PulG
MRPSLSKKRSLRQGGYILLVLLLMMALVMIAAGAIVTDIAAQIRRDREEEMIHRAMQYRRAVKRFAKNTGRFPMRLEDLEDTNGIRYLRKRYKDPLTGRDFRLLHMGDIPAGIGTSSNPWSTVPDKDAAGVADGQAVGDSAAPGGTPPSDESQNAQGLQPLQAGAAARAPQKAAFLTSSSASESDDKPLGGGMIIGVASISPKKTIREFNRKNRYNQWLFFYDPGFDRGFEVWGPTPLVRIPAVNLTLQNASSSPPSGTQAAESQAPSSAQP